MQRGLSRVVGAWPNPGMAGRGLCQAVTCDVPQMAEQALQQTCTPPYHCGFVFAFPSPERKPYLLEEM